MEILVRANPAEVAREAARRIAREAAVAIAARGCFTLALSGGTTPWLMLDQLVTLPIDWSRVHVFQVDERKARDGSIDRNWTRIQAHLFSRAEVPAGQRHPMPVLEPPDAAALGYASALRRVAGDPPQLDVVQLGLGDDGHLASLVPGDPVLDVHSADVAWTGQEYRGTHRLTLTYPCIARARLVLWLVTGEGKAPMLARLLARDPSIPAGRVPQTGAVLFCDEPAAARPR
ncbi:MAG: 6-phosphogluconolactonase [Planctomycetes bacterium]|nr:6-phosphogluconolactonase [Planctomycetota bacterium]